MRSNTYVLLFTALVTVILGFLLSVTYSQLKELQEQNVAVDMRKNILRSLDIREEEGEIWTNETVQSLYETFIRTTILDSDGRDVSGVTIEMVDAEVDTTYFPLFTKVVNGDIEGYAIPVIGRGLWSTLYGYLALEPDGITVKGIQFYKHKETPGLGGEVEKDWFTGNFIGKRVTDEEGELVSIQVLRGKVDPGSSEAYHQVDGISGATVTSKGVTNFLMDDLKKYEPFFQKIRKDTAEEIVWRY